MSSTAIRIPEICPRFRRDLPSSAYVRLRGLPERVTCFVPSIPVPPSNSDLCSTGAGRGSSGSAVHSSILDNYDGDRNSILPRRGYFCTGMPTLVYISPMLTSKFFTVEWNITYKYSGSINLLEYPQSPPAHSAMYWPVKDPDFATYMAASVNVGRPSVLSGHRQQGPRNRRCSR